MLDFNRHGIAIIRTDHGAFEIARLGDGFEVRNILSERIGYAETEAEARGLAELHSPRDGFVIIIEDVTEVRAVVRVKNLRTGRSKRYRKETVDLALARALASVEGGP